MKELESRVLKIEESESELEPEVLCTNSTALQLSNDTRYSHVIPDLLQETAASLFGAEDGDSRPQC
jgi:hypothetical protein